MPPQSLSSIIISRFLLKLRETSYAHAGPLDTSGMQSTMKFASSFAAPLSFTPSFGHFDLTESDSSLGAPPAGGYALSVCDVGEGSEDQYSEDKYSVDSMEFAANNHSASILEVRRSFEKHSLCTIPESVQVSDPESDGETACEQIEIA